MGFKGTDSEKIRAALKKAEILLREDDSKNFNPVIREIMAIRKIK